MNLNFMISDSVCLMMDNDVWREFSVTIQRFIIIFAFTEEECRLKRFI